MLTDKQIEENKNKFIELLKSINRENAKIVELVEKLEKTDFFWAPASTQYHSSFKGGLCLHSLNVYKELKGLVSLHSTEETPLYKEDTLIIVALLHDLCKMNFYETSTRNVKNGEGQWETVPYIKVKDTRERFIFSGHGANSEFMIRQFIPLSVEESVAVIHHMGYADEHIRNYDLDEIFNRFPLALFLHEADLLATFVLEKI